MHSLLSKIKKHKEQKLPFVAFSNPKENTVKAYLQLDSELNLNNTFNKKGFVFAPFDMNANKSIWFYENDCELLEIEKTTFQFKNSHTVFREHELYAQLYHQKTVAKAIAAIEKGNIYKVIISRKEIQQVKDIDVFQIFQNIVVTYPKTFCYCWYHPKVGLWMGASPEALVDINNGNFETMALAGTQPYNGSENVTWGQKEQEEQRIVVNSIVEELTDNDIVNTIEVKDTVTQKAGNLLHLKTPILAQINGRNSLKQLIEVLHPTPAVCGLPYKKSKHFIFENEGYNRSFYTGFLGEVKSATEAILFVNLRCMEVFDSLSKVAIYVGGGITAASKPEAEWFETVNKSQVMKRIL